MRRAFPCKERVDERRRIGVDQERRTLRVVHEAVARGALEAPLMANFGILMILGRNILTSCVLTYNGTIGTFTLDW